MGFVARGEQNGDESSNDFLLHEEKLVRLVLAVYELLLFWLSVLVVVLLSLLPFDDDVLQ